MGKWFDQIRLFLGAERLRVLVALFIGTGLFSAVLSRIPEEWALTAQTLVTLGFISVAVIIVVGRMEGDMRYRWGAILAPAVGILIIGTLIVPQYFLAALGAAVGWVAAGIFIFSKSRAPLQYKEAIKAMRRNDYSTAIRAMDGLIKSEPQEPNHYRFRAELLRLSNKMDRARRDYEQMLKLAQDDPTRAVACNGLAEVEIQAGRYPAALAAAQHAYQLAPNEWVAAYNLGMIQDRLSDSAGAIASLNQALAAKVPDARHRLLIYVYLGRAYARQGDTQATTQALAGLKKQRDGLREWQTIMKSEQAATLRAVLEQDIQLAAQLIAGEGDALALLQAQDQPV